MPAVSLDVMSGVFSDIKRDVLSDVMSELSDVSLIGTQWKLSLAGIWAAKVREIFWPLFAQVLFMLAGFRVICSQDCARRIFLFAQLWFWTPFKLEKDKSSLSDAVNNSFQLSVITWNIEGFLRNFQTLESIAKQFDFYVGATNVQMWPSTHSWTLSEDVHDIDLPLTHPKAKGGTCIMWKTSMSPFVKILPTSPPSVLLTPPGILPSAHTVVYLPTAGNDGKWLATLVELEDHVMGCRLETSFTWVIQFLMDCLTHLAVWSPPRWPSTTIFLHTRLPGAVPQSLFLLVIVLCCIMCFEGAFHFQKKLRSSPTFQKYYCFYFKLFWLHYLVLGCLTFS